MIVDLTKPAKCICYILYLCAKTNVFDCILVVSSILIAFVDAVGKQNRNWDCPYRPHWQEISKSKSLLKQF